MSEWLIPVIAGFQLGDNFFVVLIVLLVGAVVATVLAMLLGAVLVQAVVDFFMDAIRSRDSEPPAAPVGSDSTRRF